MNKMSLADELSLKATVPEWLFDYVKELETNYSQAEKAYEDQEKECGATYDAARATMQTLAAELLPVLDAIESCRINKDIRKSLALARRILENELNNWDVAY